MGRAVSLSTTVILRVAFMLLLTTTSASAVSSAETKIPELFAIAYCPEVSSTLVL